MALSRQDIVDGLASSTGRNDEGPNVVLAERICETRDEAAVAHLIDVLRNGARPHQNDAIKVLYEVGGRDPELVAPHTEAFVECLRGSNNRVVWGALTALAAVCAVAPDRVAGHFGAIVAAADTGSVIATDKAILILIALRSVPEVAPAATQAVFDRLRGAPVNQLPLYAEQVAAAGLTADERRLFLSVLATRLTDGMAASKRRRLRKVVAKVERMCG